MSNLTYKFKGAGHEEPEGKRKYEKPNRRLAAIFEEWLKAAEMDMLDRDENSREPPTATSYIRDKLAGCPCTVAEAHGLLIKYQDHPKIKEAGTFLTLIYNRAKDKVIIFDVDIGARINSLGHELAKGKCLVNKSNVGEHFGSCSEGLIINYGEAGDYCGDSTEGPFLNYAKCRDVAARAAEELWINAGETMSFGYEANAPLINFNRASTFGVQAKSEATLINAGHCKLLGDFAEARIIAIVNPHSYKDTSSKFKLTEADCNKIPRLVKYFGNLKQKIEEGRTDHNKAISVMENLNAQTMEENLERILALSGLGWW